MIDQLNYYVFALKYHYIKHLILAKNFEYPNTISTYHSLMNSEFEPRSRQGNVGIIGAKVWQGQKKRGVELGPDMMRQDGLIDKIKCIGVDVKDYGDINPANIPNDACGKVLNPNTVADYCKKISDQVQKIVKDDRICLILGGDHSLAAGSLHGHVSVYPDVRVVWIDAHTDLHLPYTTSSGNLHGCPMGLMIKELNTPGQNILPGWEWHKERIPAHHLVYIGLRDVDTPEMFFLKKLNIRHFSVKDIDEHGIQGVARMALQHINPKLDKPTVIQFDIDSLDPKDAPTTGTPVDGGMTLREGLELMEELCRTRCIVGIDMVEVNVKLGDEKEAQKTVRAANKLILAALGETRHGVLPRDFKITPLPSHEMNGITNGNH
ncbi:unnamed protein product [Gordionus sp. m RMFG-2023]